MDISHWLSRMVVVFVSGNIFLMPLMALATVPLSGFEQFSSLTGPIKQNNYVLPSIQQSSLLATQGALPQPQEQAVGLNVETKNVASIEQSGADNYGMITQLSQSSAAEILQKGSECEASIMQSGSLNSANIQQYGTSTDWGSRNSASITQISSGNSASIVQSGNHNRATIVQR